MRGETFNKKIMSSWPNKDGNTRKSFIRKSDASDCMLTMLRECDDASAPH